MTRSGICQSRHAEVVWIDRPGKAAVICEKGERVGYTEAGELVRIRESHFAACPNSAAHRKVRT